MCKVYRPTNQTDIFFISCVRVKIKNGVCETWNKSSCAVTQLLILMYYIGSEWLDAGRAAVAIQSMSLFYFLLLLSFVLSRWFFIVYNLIHFFIVISIVTCLMHTNHNFFFIMKWIHAPLFMLLWLVFVNCNLVCIFFIFEFFSVDFSFQSPPHDMVKQKSLSVSQKHLLDVINFLY